MLEHRSKVRVLDRADQNDTEEAHVATDIERIAFAYRRDLMAPSPRADDSWRRTHSPRRSIAKLLESPTWQLPTTPMRPDCSRGEHMDDAKAVVHFHEVLEPESAGRTTRMSIRYLRRHLNRADLVIVPDAGRARDARSGSRADNRAHGGDNCPPLLTAIPKSRLLPELRKRGVDASNHPTLPRCCRRRSLISSRLSDR